ncbi:ABC transporter substrate-binding protein [Lysinibacillus sp. 2017]|uniref:ABC transporter substrate-binding protein n=1 Tax=unclassified Lysinibacillus TaxID=2636778 RepID=UPI000D526470|nr:MULTISPECIES: ABC transporter substrate-binding protein [unclassified Lysinibacillus]AWE07412.1 ABC transporter substrate-binding protein [Lysinibacillus sp. 2017]TGN36576.1 ABC transporter substrate-binding protein [Lysinibacillus sp. S2017]
MKNLWGCFGVFIIGLIIISFIVSYWYFIVGAIALYFGVKWYINYTKNKKQQKIEETQNLQVLENQSTIEYKMERLLTLSNLTDPNDEKRQDYLSKSELNLRDYWYKYLDLRAKLFLNDTPTYREEEVIHLMCDELLLRIDNVEVEVSDKVRMEFIKENLTPLLRDVVDIMEGIRPTNSINVDAYNLLKQTK